ncbi:phosphodiester glycosidase family protein [Nocardioides carbamazepini]|uniref:phosphodiester glycosidase family protein n=1 Tax=Nocardioides carbamazepini TaxID=2854259 RepID=UPI00214A1FB7|nr:phosphodiester glycosidase family protein [Nocardioides carbamazepini]MCR1786112.1 phosphodiester glycosidase family protein [Nocardioides carbamazepini]
MSFFSRRGGSLVAACVGLAVGAGVMLVPSPAGASDRIVVEGMNLDADGTAVINGLARTEVAPGLVHVQYERLDPNGWQQVNILKADLGDETVKMTYLTPETVAGPGGTVTEMVDAADAIAGVNLDRFDINNSWAAAGWGVRDGEIIKSGNPDAAASVGMTSDGLGALVDLVLEGAATFADDSSVSITGINAYAMPAGGVALYNAQWGTYSRARALPDATAGVEVWVGPDNKVQQVAQTVGEGEIPAGTQILVAEDGSAAGIRLAALQTGDQVEVSYRIQDPGVEIEEAGGAWHRLVTGGQKGSWGGDGYFTDKNPRTMVGFSQDRRTAYFVVVDGRTAVASGMNFDQQAELMLDLGAYDAINADGGGSSQMNVRLAGDEDTTVMNTPSDGYERYDGDGMGLVLARPGSGSLVAFDVETASQDEGADRVFPGLHRALSALGVDETLSSAPGRPDRWRSSDGQVATVADGIVTGRAAGTATVRASNSAAVGGIDLQVLGELHRVELDQTVLNLEKQGSAQTLALTGIDVQGFRAPIEPADVEVVNPAPDLFSVAPTADGRFTITATGTEGSATLRFRVGGHEAQVAVAVPLELKLIDDFSDVSGWTTAHDRAPVGGIEPGEGFEGSASIRLNYDFTGSTATRGRYAVAPGTGIDIPGRPQKLSVWIKGDGKGSLLRLQVMQANGVRNWIDGPDGQQSLHATWTGWERVDFLVPETFSFPLKLERIRALETVAAKQYTGSLEFSQIYAYLPPEGVEAPVAERAQDPVVAEAGETDDSDLRVAVMSDAQFVARDPESGAVTGARQALREIVAAEPDVLVINGDFVDEASEADFDLARSILDEELAGIDFPWYYVPGNHEIMGGDIANFKTEFGDTTQVFDLGHTRFITLNSATGKLASDFAQVKMLREQLDAAAEDPSITGVLLFTHMPTNDPLPTDGSQLADRNEAAFIDDWLQEFRADSGKSVAYVAGHVGVFHAEQVDGVPYVVNGNSGKSPASVPEDGGFTGWTMLGVDPAEGRWQLSDGGTDWLKAEVETRVDELVVAEPGGVLPVGTIHDLAPRVSQDDGARTFDVAWPTSYAWKGDTGVYVGPAADAPETAVVAIDPSTHQLTALRSGSASATLTVNDAETPVQVTVTGGDLTLRGTPMFGETLTADLGEWADGAEVTYRWLRDGAVIEGATGPGHAAGIDDLGTVLTVVATVSAPDRAPIEVRAAAAEPVALARLSAPRASVRGIAEVGATVLADTGSWPEGTTLTFQWLRDGAPIPGALSSAYTAVRADLGHRLAVRVSGYLAGHEPASATSAATTAVAESSGGPGPDPVPETVRLGSVLVEGSARVGQPLRATARAWDPSTELAYQWLRDGAPISGATGSSYTPVASDLGSRLGVRVLAAEAGKIAVTAQGTADAAVAPGKAELGQVTLVGKAVAGKRLRVRVNVLPQGAQLSYVWRIGRKSVTTDVPRLALKPKQAGKRVRVTVTATAAGYEPATATSKARRITRR